MTVKEFEARVSAYLDGELSPVEMATMDQKAAECEHCRALLADVDDLTERLGQLSQVQPSAEFNFALRSHLLMEVANEKQPMYKVKRVMFSTVTRKITTLAAAVVLALGLTQMIPQNETAPAPQVAVEEAEFQLESGKTVPNVDIGALELDHSYRLDSRHFRDSARVDTSARTKQVPANVREQHNVKPVPVSYSF